MADTGQITSINSVAGVRVGTACAGIKRRDRHDLTVFELCEGAECAAVFTRNQFCAAPVQLARSHLQRANPRFLLINSGNANAGTGARGLADALETCRVLAEQGGCGPEAVLPFSTGVIGEPLPVSRIAATVTQVCRALSADGWEAAARAIMTTDTVPKLCSKVIEVNGQAVTVTGIAKGAGMIRPDMATMLSFVATDAPLSRAALHRCLQYAVDQSFNRITVDGDTSTNDACVLIATGKADLPRIEEAAGEAYAAIEAAVTEVCIALAQAIVRDGEGATKFIAVEVGGGGTEAECLQVAYSIANSPLVKTAFFASDPNWGRILAAVGRSGIPDLDLERISIHLDEVCIVRNGARAPDYREELGQTVMARKDIAVKVDLGRGPAQATVWTCDFSYDYVRINADYRT
jgi:glutamate N-acetyltransferase/amino-acid N-acetyltransferase